MVLNISQTIVKAFQMERLQKRYPKQVILIINTLYILSVLSSLSFIAKDNEIYLIGGSIPEKEGDKLYNTCPIFDPKGNLIAKHRKV